MIKLTFNSTMSAIRFNEDNIKEIEERFGVSIKKIVHYKISDDDDRQHWGNVNVGDFVCQRDGERHINIVSGDRFQGLLNEAIKVAEVQGGA